MLKIYNTLKRKKEEFKPITHQVGMYVCGVTVYDFCHFGHGRTFVTFDMIARYLRYLGYNLKYVRNITDIDDKIIQRANSLNIPFQQLTKEMIAEMHTDFEKLNLLPPDVEPRATEHISEIIQLIQNLLSKNFAYRAESGDIMFKVDSFPQYGLLSGQNLAELKSDRVTIKQIKQSETDFVLWKLAKPNEPSWESPFGLGRPGWHIECSAMNHKELGSHFDIHGGGSDLMFPHHENEIAQSYCGYGNKFVNYWLHSGMLTVDNVKMSKSLGNFFTLKDMFAKHNPEVLRYFFLMSHYRSSLNYSAKNIQLAQHNLSRFYIALRDCDLSLAANLNESYVEKFKQAMDDDFNTPLALSVLFNIVKEINSTQDKILKSELALTLKELGGVLGLFYQEPDDFLKSDLLDSDKIESLINQRNQAKSNKNWVLADEIREELKALGVIIEDTPNGIIWRSSLK